MTMIFQSPVAAFNPVFRVGAVFLGALRLHGASRADAAERAKSALRDVRLSEEMLNRYPHQLSGGQAQRVAVALSLALRSELLLADEPTSALDVTVQAEVLELIRDLCDRHEVGVLFVTHDLAVVAQLCQRVNVMQAGRIVEHGRVSETLRSPMHPYTKDLVALRPTPLCGRGIAEHARSHRPRHQIRLGGRGRRRVSRASPPGRTGLAWSARADRGRPRSGAAIVRLIDCDSGWLSYEGLDVTRLRGRPLRAYRSKVQIVFQDPYSALDPRRRVGSHIAEALRTHDVGGAVRNGWPGARATRRGGPRPCRLRAAGTRTSCQAASASAS